MHVYRSRHTHKEELGQEWRAHVSPALGRWTLGITGTLCPASLAYSIRLMPVRDTVSKNKQTKQKQPVWLGRNDTID